jgi:hypothetical protein
MLAAFCLRLALGMVAFLPLLPAKQMHPRFFRTQFLVALGLTVVALISDRSNGSIQDRSILIGTLIVILFGTLAWTIDPPPFGRALGVLATALLIASEYYGIPVDFERFPNSPWLRGVDAVSAGLLLGSAVTAMLVGHSYLISPNLTIRPLTTMIVALFVSLALRTACLVTSICIAMRQDISHVAFEPYYLYLIPRIVIGLGGPLVFGTMAFLTARIRSTQSATGILFVVVICTFLGELMSLVLTRMAGWPL